MASVCLAYSEFCTRATRIEQALLRKFENDGFNVHVLFEYQYNPIAMSEYNPKSKALPGSWIAKRIWGERAFVRVSFLALEGNVSSIDELELGQFRKLRRFSLASDTLRSLSGVEDADFLKRIRLSNSKLLHSDQLCKLGQLGSLQTLNLDNLGGLTHLKIDGFPTQDICVDDCSELEKFECSNITTQLTIDLQNCSNLSFVRVSKCELTDVFITNCNRLKSILLWNIPDAAQVDSDQAVEVERIMKVEHELNLGLNMGPPS